MDVDFTTNSDRLAVLHAACFDKAWDAAAFASMLAVPGTFALTGDGGFLLARAVADEAELLTIGVLPDWRRQGVADALLAQLEAELRRRGVAALFLEVAENNAPARALYQARGFAEYHRRPGYYTSNQQPPQDALLLRKYIV